MAIMADEFPSKLGDGKITLKFPSLFTPKAFPPWSIASLKNVLVLVALRPLAAVHPNQIPRIRRTPPWQKYVQHPLFPRDPLRNDNSSPKIHGPKSSQPRRRHRNKTPLPGQTVRRPRNSGKIQRSRWKPNTNDLCEKSTGEACTRAPAKLTRTERFNDAKGHAHADPFSWDTNSNVES